MPTETNSKNCRLLLTISITGSIPDFSTLYHKLGFDVASAGTMRKALALIKSQAPTVVVAEFVYAPTYGSQLSNFESLLATMESFAAKCKLIAIVFPEDVDHCQRVLNNYNVCTIVQHPVSESKLEEILKETNSN